MSLMTYVRIEPSVTRLGNWMFQYAAAKCANGNGPLAFVIPHDQMQWADAVEKYRVLWGETKILDEADFLADADRSPRLREMRVGLFQDAKYVDRELSRTLFLGPLKESSRPSSTSTLNFDALVSIHVRRGDYMALPHRHPFVGKKYLRDAIARFPNAQFLVFSDDIPWCKRFFTPANFPSLTHHAPDSQERNVHSPTPHSNSPFLFSEGNSVLTDLYLMTQCTGGHICSNSTFSWWGAYLGEGKTIFPSMWYGPAIKGVDWRGMYFEGSEVVENGYLAGLWVKARMCMVKNALGDVLRKVGLR